MVVIGPEAPLAAGLADSLEAAGIQCFGPKAKAAEIEANKEWSKKFMDRHGIPTAKFASFKDSEEAKEFIQRLSVYLIHIFISELYNFIVFSLCLEPHSML